jgi:hypothetical protein
LQQQQLQLHQQAFLAHATQQPWLFGSHGRASAPPTLSTPDVVAALAAIE